MRTKSVVVIDEIDESRKRLFLQIKEAHPDLTLNELIRASDEIIFQHTPHNWGTLLNERKLVLWLPTQKESLNRYSIEFGNIAVTLMGRSKIDRQIIQTVLKEQGKENPHVVELTRRIEEWPNESVRFHRSKVAIDGKRYIQWKSTISLIANKKLGWRPKNFTPVGAWRLQTRVLFPIDKKPLSRAHLLPVVRIDVLDSIENEWDEAVSTALYETIANFIIQYARDIENDLLHVHDEVSTQTQFTAEVNFVDQSIERAMAFANWFKNHYLDDSFDYDDIPTPMFFIATITPGAEEEVPGEIERKKPAPVTDASGKPIYMLLEFELNNICKMADGRIYQRCSVELAEGFEDQYRCTVRSFLDRVGYQDEDFTVANENGEAVTYLNTLAIDADTDFITIRDALYAARVPKGKWKFPTVRLLVNQLTRQHVIEVGIETKLISEFLAENGIKLFAESENYFPIFKVPLTLQNKYPDLAEWVTKNKANLIRPSSGFDSGAHVVRLWRDAFNYIFYIDKYRTWRDETPTWQDFLRYSKCISTFLNCDDQECDFSEFRSALIHMPESLKARH